MPQHDQSSKGVNMTDISIVEQYSIRGYQGNSKSVYFFLRKDFERTKTGHKQKPTNKTKTSKH